MVIVDVSGEQFAGAGFAMTATALESFDFDLGGKLVSHFQGFVAILSQLR